MERVLEHVNALDVATLGVVALVVCVALLLMPSRHRIAFLLVITPGWMFAYMGTQVPFIASASKVTNPILLAALAALCAWHRGDSGRSLPRVAALYPGLAVIALIAVIGSSDAPVAMAQRFHWLLVVAAAWQIARMCSSREDTEWVIGMLSWAALIVIAICLAALLFDPEAALRPTQARFEPWGVGSIQAGSITMAAGPLFAWRALKASRRRPEVFLWLVALALALGLTLLSGSRTAVFAAVAALVPLGAASGFSFLRDRRRMGPIILLAAGLTAAVLTAVITLAPTFTPDRYTTIETQRYRILVDYLESIEERPLTGLLLTQGEGGIVDEEIGQHAHNVYVLWIYLVGIPLAAGIPLVAYYSLRRAWLLPRTTLGLAASGIVMAGWISGVATLQIHQPGNPISLLHTVMVLLVLSSASRRDQAPSFLDRLDAPLHHTRSPTVGVPAKPQPHPYSQ